MYSRMGKRSNDRFFLQHPVCSAENVRAKPNPRVCRVRVAGARFVLRGALHGRGVVHPTNMIRAAIFDVDGTLIDSVDAHARAWQLALDHFGHHESFEKVRHQIGKGGDQLMPVFLSKDELQREGEALEKFRGDLFKRDFMHTLKPFPKVRELFLKIRELGIQAVLASSAKADELEYYKKLCNIDDLIEANTSSDDAEKSKPYPDIFQAALAKTKGVRPDQAVVIGDTPYDVIAAKRADIESIGMLCGGFPETELRHAGAIAIFQDPANLLENAESSPLIGDEPLKKPA